MKLLKKQARESPCNKKKTQKQTGRYLEAIYSEMKWQDIRVRDKVKIK